MRVVFENILSIMNRPIRLLQLSRVVGAGCLRLTHPRLFAPLILLILCLLAVPASYGQPTPTVSIAMGRATAREGETFIAHVFIDDVTYLSSADVGINVNERCLRIVDQGVGTLLPLTDGIAIADSSVDDHTARLGLVVTDRSLLATGGGILYSVKLEVTCASGAAALEITYAELSAYVDPLAEPVDVQSYTLDAGTLNVENALLQIGPIEAQTRLPATPTIPPTATPDPATAETAQALTRTLNTLNITFVVLLVILVVVVLYVIYLIAKRVFRGAD